MLSGLVDNAGEFKINSNSRQPMKFAECVSEMLEGLRTYNNMHKRKFKQPLDNPGSHDFTWNYYIRLTAFFQDNLGKPAPER